MTSGLGLGLLMYGVSEGPDVGWRNDASTVFNAQRQLGGAIGVAVLTTVITPLHPLHRVAGHTVANLHAYHVGFAVAAAIAVLASATALAVSDADAASTIVARRNKDPLDVIEPVAAL